MNVLHTPYIRDNPYQDILIDHLADNGITATPHRNAHVLTFLLAILRKRPDVVHLHWVEAFYLTTGRHTTVKDAAAALLFIPQLLLATLLTDRIVWTVHNNQNHARQSPRIEYLVKSLAARVVDAVHVWDTTTQHDVTTTYNISVEKTVIIPHGHYKPVYDDVNRSQAAARDTLSLPDDATVFLFFGKLRPYKQIHHLIDTFTAAATGDSILVIAGNPATEGMERYVTAADDNNDTIVTAPRYIPDSDVPTYFAAADIAVFPYRDVFNSGAVILAMTFGVPVIAPRLGAIPSILPDDNFTYDADTGDGLRNAVETAAATPRDRLADIGHINEQTVDRNHDWSAVTRQTIAMYHGDTS